MNKFACFAALLTLAAAPAFAGSTQFLSIDEIAATTGMEKREVLLMVGPVSNNTLHQTSYIRISREWKDAVKATGLVLEQRRDANGQIATLVRRAADSEV